MTDPRLIFERARYVALRERLIADDPDIDERSLLDTLEGISDYKDALVEIVRDALEDEDEAEKIRGQIKVKQARLKRFEDRAARRRELVRDEMLEANIPKLQPPEFTAALRTTPRAVVITDESKIPDEYLKTVKTPIKELIKEAINAGEFIEGAELNNPRMNLNVRQK